MFVWFDLNDFEKLQFSTDIDHLWGIFVSEMSSFKKH